MDTASYLRLRILKDVLRHASVMLSAPIDWLVMHLTVVQKHTLESVTVSPFFLPRVKSTLDNLGHCRKQIWEALRPYAGTIDNADYCLRVFMWPRDGPDLNTLGRL